MNTNRQNSVIEANKTTKTRYCEGAKPKEVNMPYTATKCTQESNFYVLPTYRNPPNTNFEQCNMYDILWIIFYCIKYNAWNFWRWAWVSANNINILWVGTSIMYVRCMLAGCKELFMLPFIPHTCEMWHKTGIRRTPSRQVVWWLLVLYCV